MKLYFKQNLFSILDSYKIYYENGSIAYEVHGELALSHKLRIYDAKGNEVGLVKQKIITLLPKFCLYVNGESFGELKRKLSLLFPSYELTYNHWYVSGDLFEWNYEILDENDQLVATVSKQLFHLTDHYVIDVVNEKDALLALMFTLAIDAEKCSRDNG